jgi:hypothetical protein
MALIALGVVALLAVVIWVPKVSFIQPGGLTKATDRAKAESDLRGHLLQALAGLVLAVGAFYTGRTFAQNRKEQDRNYALAREGQHTERFTRAVSQLADEKLDVRLGGIYALERIARDSETYYEPVYGSADGLPPGEHPLAPGDRRQGDGRCANRVRGTG